MNFRHFPARVSPFFRSFAANMGFAPRCLTILFIMKRTLMLSVVMAIAVCSNVSVRAQEWFQLHVNYGNNHWAFPYQMDHISYFDFVDDEALQVHFGEDEDEVIVPFALDGSTSKAKYDAVLDSISFSSTLTTWGKDKYRCFAIYVTTNDGSSITSKEDYTDCYISIDGMGEYPDMSGTGRIRGRGNSTWEWYPKKPYRIKFDMSSKVLGIEKNKDWVLLANYRDVTDMMNVYASITAKWMGIPYTTPVRFAELFLNGEYKGIYQIAEQIEVGGHRVDIDEQNGLLLTLDLDDGPELSPYAGDNFSTEVYHLPMAVKSPKNLTSEQLSEVKSEFAVLERAIKAKNYTLVDSLMDIPSYIAMLQLQEYLYNVELSAPRSIYLFRDFNGKFTFGPAWDWDAGYDFDWSDMTTGHTFFTNYKETIFGSDPYRRNGNYRCSEFFTNMFGNASFVRQYKEQWNTIRDSIYTRNWEETQKYLDGLNELTSTVTPDGQPTYTSPQQRETERWPIKGFTPASEVTKMKRWLRNRLTYIDDLIQNYPQGDEDPIIDPVLDGWTLAGTLQKSYELTYSGGYKQSVSVEVTKDEVARLLGVDASALSATTLDLVPLNADGTEGSNTAAKKYGAWFDENGNTITYQSGEQCVYIESDDLWTWKCGLEQSNCWSGDEYTVTMQYRYATAADKSEGLLVNVQVTFTVTGGWGGWGW